jgi:hypothetical protein
MDIVHTTALELAHQGVNPTIVDTKDAPSELSRAVVSFPIVLKFSEKPVSAIDCL